MSGNEVLNKNDYYIIANNRGEEFFQGCGKSKRNYVFMKMEPNMIITVKNDTTVFLNSVKLSLAKSDVFAVVDYLSKEIMSL